MTIFVMVSRSPALYIHARSTSKHALKRCSPQSDKMIFFNRTSSLKQILTSWWQASHFEALSQCLRRICATKSQFSATSWYQSTWHKAHREHQKSDKSECSLLRENWSLYSNKNELEHRPTSYSNKNESLVSYEFRPIDQTPSPLSFQLQDNSLHWCVGRGVYEDVHEPQPWKSGKKKRRISQFQY